MAVWKTGRVSDVVGEIAEEKYVLPVIQRSLVWTEEKMEMLFDTLLRGDSFGGVMVIEEEKNSKPLFNFRPFTKDGELIASRQVDKLNQTQNFVIDGQQRLQSFYIGLTGSINGKVLYLIYTVILELNLSLSLRMINANYQYDQKRVKIGQYQSITGFR